MKMKRLPTAEGEEDEQGQTDQKKWRSRVLHLFALFLNTKSSRRISRSCVDCVVTQVRLRMRAQQFPSTAARAQTEWPPSCPTLPFPLSITYHWQPNTRSFFFFFFLFHPCAFKTFKQHSSILKFEGDFVPFQCKIPFQCKTL